MNIDNSCVRRTASAALLVGLSGCISADPEPAIDRTALIASDRTNSTLTLQDAWSQPFTDRSGLWDGTSPLDIETALGVALRNDPDLRRQLALVAEHQADLAQASLPPNPIVGFGVGMVIDGMGGAPAMLELMQQLTWLWTISDRIDVADERLQAMILAAARGTVDRASQVRTRFLSLVHARDFAELRAAYVETTATTLELVQALANVGELPMVEVDRARIDHRAAEAALARAQRAIRTSKLELLRVIGWPEHTTNFSIEGDFAWTLLDAPPSETEVIERAVIVRLDVAAAEQRVLAAEANARLAGWRRIPEVGLMVGWNRNFSGREAITPGASISIPILDNGYAAIAKTGAQLESARLAAAIVREDAIKQARTALNQWLKARQQVAIYEDGLVASARNVVERSEKAFEAGATDATELLLTQRRMIQLEVELLEEKLRASLAWVDLENAVGGSFALPLERPTTREGEPS